MTALPPPCGMPETELPGVDSVRAASNRLARRTIRSTSWGDAELRPLIPSPQIMAMPSALRQFAVDDLDGFPDDGNRYELLHGVLLVTPQAGLTHQTVAMRLVGGLVAFLQDEPGVQVWAPGVIQIRPSIHLEPDILVGRLPSVARWEAVRDHWLAVEVSGTGSRVYDRDYKRDGYLEVGVAEVWLVDLDLERVFVSRPGNARDVPHATSLTWCSPGGRLLQVDLAALFRGVPKGD